MEKYDVIAIGELNVDLIFSGLKSMPVLGQEIIADKADLVLGSSTAICACGLSRLGLKTGFIGKVGSDAYADIVINTLLQSGIDTSHIIADPSVSTGLTISLSMQNDRALVTYPGSIETLKAEDVNMLLFNETKHIHVGSFFLQKALRPGLANLFQNARNKGVSTSLDAGWDDTNNWDYGLKNVLAHTDIFFPNETEALHITNENSVCKAAEVLSGYCGIAVVKMGAQGAYVQKGKTVLQKLPYNTEPVDKTGSGDCFNAGFLYGFLQGYSLEKCLDYGNACGSISITRVGGIAACAGLDEVEKMIAGTRHV